MKLTKEIKEQMIFDSPMNSSNYYCPKCYGLIGIKQKNGKIIKINCKCCKEIKIDENVSFSSATEVLTEKKSHSDIEFGDYIKSNFISIVFLSLFIVTIIAMIFVRRYYSIDTSQQIKVFNQEIKLKVEITEANINKNILLIDESFGELTTETCDMFIDNKRIEFSNYYSFDKLGEHIIEIKFNHLFLTCKYMFFECSELKEIDLSKINTEKVEDMSYMFSGCTGITSLDLSSFNTQNVIDMSYMLYRCSNLENVKLSSFKTEKVIDMQFLFYDCNKLSSIDLSNFNTERLQNMHGIFYQCSKIESLDLSNFNTTSVRDVNYMISECSNLKYINLCSFDLNKFEFSNYMLDFIPENMTIKIQEDKVKRFRKIFKYSLKINYDYNC